MIVLQFSREPALSSDVIAWFGSGDLSHVDAVLPDGLLGARSDTVGGKPPGVQVRPPDYAKFAKVVRLALQVSPAVSAAFELFLRAQVGKPYDEKAIEGFFIDANLMATGAWFCSQLQIAALQTAGACPRLYLPPNKITPDSLAVVMTALGAVIV